MGALPGNVVPKSRCEEHQIGVSQTVQRKCSQGEPPVQAHKGKVKLCSCGEAAAARRGREPETEAGREAGEASKPRDGWGGGSLLGPSLPQRHWALREESRWTSQS